MKTKNFPGRKNTRRISALERLCEIDTPTKQQIAEAGTLSRRIVDPEQARAIRTKKRRALRA